MKITAIVIVNGNPPHFNASINSIITEVDEIIIGDVGLDVTLTAEVMAKSKIIKLDPKIPFADLVKEDLKKKASGDYILYLDPDEIIPSKLWVVLKKEMESHDYFLIPRKNIIFGKWIQHSRWWPDHQLRFFRKENVIWIPNLHPKPEAKGKEYKVVADESLAILHHNYDDINHYLEKAQRYAKFEAKDLMQKEQSLSLSATFKRSTSEFMSRYFLYEGYKDGTHGLVLSLLQMFYYWLVYFYFWEGKKYRDLESDKVTNTVQDFFAETFYESSYWLIKKKLITTKERIKLKIIKSINKI